MSKPPLAYNFLVWPELLEANPSLSVFSLNLLNSEALLPTKRREEILPFLFFLFRLRITLREDGFFFPPQSFVPRDGDKSLWKAPTSVHSWSDEIRTGLCIPCFETIRGASMCAFFPPPNQEEG